MRNRRHFLKSLSAAAGALGAAPFSSSFAFRESNPYAAEIGLQLYTLRKEIKNDVGATMQAVADAGYKQGEMYGFPNCDDMIKAAQDSGIALHSSHFEWETVTSPSDDQLTEFSAILDKAKDVGLSHLVIPYLHDKDRATLDDYKRVAERCNKAAALAKEAGIQLAYHNHAFEFEPKDGERSGFDVFIDAFSEDMKFELDVFWVVVGGHDPSEMLGQLEGRVSQVHLKDLNKDVATPNFGNLAPEAFDEIGDGQIPMQPIMQAAAESGVAHCHVEQDQSPDALASIRQSIGFLEGLK